VAGAPPIQSNEDEELWLSYALAVPRAVLRGDLDKVEDTEVAHYVVSVLWNNWEPQERSEMWERWGRLLDSDDPHDRLIDLGIKEIAPRLAAAGHFQLI
jgi:hypothetical protein